MKFVKMEGAGNDYVFVDAISQSVSYDPQFIRELSDRHYGIGSDGMIALEHSDCADFRMRMFNSDGSEGLMCGNGLRCLAKFVYDAGYTKKQDLVFETASGLRHVSLSVEDRQVKQVTIDMGKPDLQTHAIGMNVDSATFVDQTLLIDEQTLIGTAVSMGNPHFIIFVDSLDLDVLSIADRITRSAYFSQGVNVEFVRVDAFDEITVRVVERGAGETLACGTGACAAMYVSYLKTLTGPQVKVNMPGGVLHVEHKNHQIYLTGPARTVFKGEYKDE